jgi:sec-independent protein translocase protein TatA
MLNAPEIIVIGVVTFLFVGAKRMPELAKALGQGIREFKKASSDAADEAFRAIQDAPPPPRAEKAAIAPENSESKITPATVGAENPVDISPQSQPHHA